MEKKEVTDQRRISVFCTEGKHGVEFVRRMNSSFSADGLKETI